MKKIKVLLSIMLVVVFALGAMGSGDSSSEDQGDGTVQNEETKGTIGDYKIVIDSCRMAKDYEGKSVVIVKYLFENVSNEESTAFAYTFEDTVYQNGVGLNEAYILDDSANYSLDNQTKEIKAGSTIEVEVAYELNDETTDIEVEVEELFSFDDVKITKTFSIVQ